MLKTQNRVLAKTEIARVVKYHKFWRRRNLPEVQLRFAIFRLSCCCGLRCKEIIGLNLGDFFLDSASPFIRIRKDITKGYRKRGTEEIIRKPRKVALYLDEATLEDVKRWHKFRMEQTGGDLSAPYVCGQQKCNLGKRMTRLQAAAIWHTSLRCLGADRARSLSIHSGRHTCISQLVWSGVPLTFVRDFAGHRSIATTSEYLHTCDETMLPKNVFNV